MSEESEKLLARVEGMREELGILDLQDEDFEKRAATLGRLVLKMIQIHTKGPSEGLVIAATILVNILDRQEPVHREWALTYLMESLEMLPWVKEGTTEAIPAPAPEETH